MIFGKADSQQLVNSGIRFHSAWNCLAFCVLFYTNIPFHALKRYGKQKNNIPEKYSNALYVTEKKKGEVLKSCISRYRKGKVDVNLADTWKDRNCEIIKRRKH